MTAGHRALQSEATHYQAANPTMLDVLLQLGPLPLALLVLWKLPEWTQKWITVARDLRDYRSSH